MRHPHLARLGLLVAAALLVASLAGCAGAKTRISAPTSQYPLSFSQGIRDNTGRLWWGDQLVRVGVLKIRYTAVGMGYSFGTIGYQRDISAEVNRQVAAVGGEAVVNLAVRINTSCNFLNSGILLLSILPFWPGCSPVEISGEIVRRDPRQLGLVPASLPVAERCRSKDPRACALVQPLSAPAAGSPAANTPPGT